MSLYDRLHRRPAIHLHIDCPNPVAFVAGTNDWLRSQGIDRSVSDPNPMPHLSWLPWRKRR